MTKILLIEDERILREEVLEWLTLEGYEALGAGDGVEGVEKAFQHLPDLIVCDITMPRLDGHGVLLEMRSNPATAHISFIFVTARAAYEDMRRGMDLGADDYLTKPFSRLQLLQAIESRLEKKALQEQNYERNLEHWRQALDEEREQRLLKSRLVAMFSHDFRNPLASIMSTINLLRDYPDQMDETKRLKHLNRAEGSVRQLLQMLDDMLILAQMETGALEFRPEQVNIGDLFQGIVEEFQTIHQETHHIIYENSLQLKLMADPRLLRRIAANLISNAVKYSPAGEDIYFRLGKNDRQYIFAVQDQGIGIPQNEQERLFEAFQRASNVGAIRGTGLGLAIVKQAVDLHGGRIDLESQMGVGTTVSVSIPQ